MLYVRKILLYWDSVYIWYNCILGINVSLNHNPAPVNAGMKVGYFNHVVWHGYMHLYVFKMKVQNYMRAHCRKSFWEEQWLQGCVCEHHTKDGTKCCMSYKICEVCHPLWNTVELQRNEMLDGLVHSYQRS